MPFTPQLQSSQLSNPQHLGSCPIGSVFNFSDFVTGRGIFGLAPVPPVRFSGKF